jgi:hypothetical protein
MIVLSRLIASIRERHPTANPPNKRIHYCAMDFFILRFSQYITSVLPRSVGIDECAIFDNMGVLHAVVVSTRILHSSTQQFCNFRQFRASDKP